jgi:beta-glucosidase
VDVSLKIQNTGSVAGDEVAQVYLEKPEHPPAGVQFADNILAGFERVRLAPGQSGQTVIHVKLRQLQYWSTAQKQWVTVVGSRTLWVGGSSRDHRLEARFDVRAGAAPAAKGD